MMEQTRKYTFGWHDLDEHMQEHAFAVLSRKLDAVQEDDTPTASRIINAIECLGKGKFAIVRHGNFLNLALLLDNELYLGAAKRSVEDKWDATRGIHLALEDALDVKPLDFPKNGGKK